MQSIAKSKMNCQSKLKKTCNIYVDYMGFFWL